MKESESWTNTLQSDEAVSTTRLYTIWRGMRNRCYRPSQINYKNYGEKGIRICKEWHDFAAFYHWSMSNGYTPMLTIDRIDSTGNYEPSNCRWATTREQLLNYSRNVNITYEGVTKTVTEWAEETGMHYRALLWRAENWEPERLFDKPKRTKITPEIKESVHKLEAQGYTLQDTASALGIAVRTVSAIRKELREG